MKHLLVIAALLVSASAFATPPGSGTVNGNGCVENCGNNGTTPTPNSNANANRVTNLQGQLQGQVQGQLQGQNQTAVGGTGIGLGGAGGAGGAGGNATGGSSSASSDARSTATASNAGNTQSTAVTFTSPESSSVKTVGIAPDMIAYPTAPCRIAISASAGWLGGAFGFGGSVLDESCRRIEVSRQLHNLGLKDAAVKVMCNEPEAAKALGEATCPQPKQEPTVTVSY